MNAEESARHATAVAASRRRFPLWSGLLPSALRLRTGDRVWICGVGPDGTPGSATKNNAWKLWSAEVLMLGDRGDGEKMAQVKFAYRDTRRKRRRGKSTSWIPLANVVCVPPPDQPPDDPPDQDEVAEVLCCRTYFGETKLLTRWLGYHDPMDFTWQPVEGDTALPNFAVDLCEIITRGKSLDLADPDVAVAFWIKGDGHGDRRVEYVLDLKEHEVVDGRVQLRLKRSKRSVTMALQDQGGERGEALGGESVEDRSGCDHNNSEMSNLTATTPLEEEGDDDDALDSGAGEEATDSPGNTSEEDLEEGAKWGGELADAQTGILPAPPRSKIVEGHAPLIGLCFGDEENGLAGGSNMPTMVGKEQFDDDEEELLGAYLWKITRGQQPASFGFRPKHGLLERPSKVAKTAEG